MMVKSGTCALALGAACLGLLGCGSAADEDPDVEVTSGSIVINEVLASNVSTVVDEFNEYDDFIELYNLEDEDLNLGGYFISDDAANQLRVQLEPELVVPARGVLLLWADGDPTQGFAHLDFKLDTDGEEVVLSAPDQQAVDHVVFTALGAGESLARFPDGTGELARCSTPTAGELNGDACGP